MKRLLPLLLCLLLCLNVTAFAESNVPADYPSGKTITFIVNRAAGGATDQVARAVANYIQSDKGYTTVVLNLEGGDGLIGANEGVNSEPDGYTFLVIGSTEIPNLLVNFEEVNFTADDLAPVCQLTSKSKILVLKPNSDYTTLDEFIAYAKDHPYELTCAVPGSNNAYGVTLLGDAMGVGLTVINAQSGNDAFTMVLGGHVDCAEIGSQFYDSCISEGMIVLGDTSDRAEHVDDAADTFLSMGYDLIDTNFNYILAPKGTPVEILQAMSDFVAEMIENGELGTALDNTKQGRNFKGYEEFEPFFNDYVGKMIRIYTDIESAE